MRKMVLLIFGLFLFFAGGGAKTILFIGDSITDGNWGSPTKYPCSSDEHNQSDLNHILGHGFVEMISGYFMGEFPDSNYFFINRGISGETLQQIASRWNRDAMAYKPDVISLLCGTNNVHYWLESNPSSVNEFDFLAYESTLDSLINETRENLPESSIFICTPFVANVGRIGEAPNYPLRQQAIDSIAAITREIVKRDGSGKVYLVDFHDLKETLLKENGNASYWIWDGIHPTTAMHHRMSQLWINSAKSSREF